MSFFTRESLHVVTIAKGSHFTFVALNSFTLHAFSLPVLPYIPSVAGDPMTGLRALGIIKDGSTENRSKVDSALKRLSPHIMADEHYRVVAERPLTLPPQQLSNHGNARQKFRKRAVCLWNCLMSGVSYLIERIYVGSVVLLVITILVPRAPAYVVTCWVRSQVKVWFNYTE